MPSPGLRVIHRSTLQEAIKERAGEKNKERPENKSEEQNKKNPEEQGSKRTEEDDKDITEEEASEKAEEQDKEKAERQEKENATEKVKEGRFLKEILEALEAAKGKPKKKESSKSQAGKNIVDSSPGIEIDTNGEEKVDERNKEEGEAGAASEVSRVVVVLEKLEQAHYEQRRELIELNNVRNDSALEKVSKMEEKIIEVKETFRSNTKNDLALIDQPNPEGETALHTAANLDDDEATQLLLEAGANPNVVDSEGNTPLHIICSQGH